MLTMRGAPPLLLTEADRVVLEAIAVSTGSSYGAVRQAAGLLLAASGVPNEEIARRVDV